MLSSSLVSSVEYDLTVARQLAYFFISYSPDGQDREVEPEQFFSDILHLSTAGVTVSTTGTSSASSAAPSLHSTAANAASQIRVTISNPVQRPRQGTCAVLIELTRPLTWLSHRGRPRGGAATTGSSGSGHGNSSSAAAVGGGGGEANTASGGPSVASTHPTASAGDSAGGNTSGGGGGGLGSSVSHPWNSSMAGSAASQAGGASSRPAGGAARTSQPGGSHRAAPPPPPPSHAAATPASPALPLLVATATFEIIFPARYPHEGCQWLLSEEVALGGGGDRASSSWAVTGNHHRGGGSSSSSGRSLAVSGVAASQHRRAGAWTGGAQPSVDNDTASHRLASTRLLAASAGDSGTRSALGGGVGASPPQQHSSATGGDGPSASAPAEDATAHLTAFVVPRLGRRFLRWIAEARSHSTESSTASSPSSPLSTHPPSRPSHSDASPFLMDFACLLRCWCAVELDVHHLLLPPRVALAYGGGGARLLRAMAGSHLSGGAVGGVSNAPPPPSGGAAGAVLSPSSSASAAAAAVAASSSTAAAAFSPIAATALSSGGVASSAPASTAAVTTASAHSGGAGGAHGAAFGAYGVKAAATGPAAAHTSNNNSSSGGGGGGVVTAAATAGASAATVPALLSAPLVSSSSSSGGGVGGSGSGSGGAASGGVGGPTATSAGGGASALYPYRRRAVRHFLAVLLPDGRVAVCGSPPTAPTAHRRAAGHAIAKSTAAGPSTTAATAGVGAVEGRLEKIPLCLLPLYEGAKGKKEGSDATTMNAARTKAATHNDPADKAPAASPRRFGVPGTLLGCTSQFTRGKLLPSFLLPTHVLGSPYKCEWGDLCLFTGKGADAALHANAKLAKALHLPHISDLLQVLRRLSRNVGTTTTGVVYISEVLWPTLVETVRVLRGSRLPFWAGVAVCALLLPSVLEQEERRHRIDQQDSSDVRRGGGAAQVSVVPVMPPTAAAAASTAALPTETTSGVPSTTPAVAAVAAAATSARPVRRWTQHIADLIQVVAYVERVLAIAKEYTLLCEARLVRCAMQRGLQMLVHEWQHAAAAGENGGGGSGAVLSPAALPSLATVPPAPLEMCRRLHAPISVCAVCGLSLLRNTVKLDAATAAADARARTPASLSPEVERKGSELAMGRARGDAANNAAASVVGVLRSRRAEGCLVVQCARCGHGGHVEHMSSWWTDPTVHCCPKGCDCICEY